MHRYDKVITTEIPPEASPQSLITDVAGVILAGGKSSRMGRNKALLEINGERMIETAYRLIAEIFTEVLLVTNTPEIYDFIHCRKIADIYPAMGPLAGIHAALSHCSAERAFVTACDMPDLNPALIRELCSISGAADVVVPESPGGLEPLHAVYSKSCLPKMDEMLRDGKSRILSFLDLVQVRLVPRDKVAFLDSAYASFRNINTPEDYRQFEQSD
jgi:molybdopterin-guanine dinucleotide biosynthesis protein A